MRIVSWMARRPAEPMARVEREETAGEGEVLVRVAGCGSKVGGSPAGASSQSSSRTASLMLAASSSISAALSSLPRTRYASAAAFAPAHWYALSARS